MATIKLLPTLALLLVAAAQAADSDAPPPPDGPAPLPDALITADPPAVAPAPQAISPDCSFCTEQAAKPAERRDFFTRLRGEDSEGYSIVSIARGLSTHKPMFFLPVTYSRDYQGEQTEVIFAISAKQQLFGSPWYFGYSQRSFWQLYDGGRSRPFRESDYNPEIFYRWTPDPERFSHWGADFGLEHESNGQDLPLSRSWNRLYVAPFRAKGKALLYLKAWYRIPEDDRKTPDDPKGDDNPDIEDHYGYGEAHFQRQIGKGQLIHTMVRMNPATGHGAINVNYTVPSDDGYLFYQVYFWQGYGESLLDYDDSVTRLGIGFALAR